jgi:hypothetical protein
LPPRNGFQIALQSNCTLPGNVPGVALRVISISRGYQQTGGVAAAGVCADEAGAPQPTRGARLAAAH